MNFIVAKDILKKAVGVARLALGEDENNIVSNFLFRVKDKKLDVLASDKRIVCKLALSIEGEPEDSSFTLEGERIRDIVDFYPLDSLEFEYNSERRHIKIYGERRKVLHLASLKPEDFPYFDEELEAAEQISEISAKKLIKSLNFVSRFGGVVETRPELMITVLRNSQFIASSGKVVGIARSDEFTGEIKIPNDILGNLIKFIEIHGEDVIRILESENFYFFKSASEAYFGFVKIERNFPKVPFDIDQEDIILKVDRERLYNSIKLLSATLDREIERMGVVLENSKMRIFAIAPNREVSEVEIDIERKEQKKLEFNINPTRFIEILPLYEEDNIDCAISLKSNFLKFFGKSDGINLLGIVVLLGRGR